jgi:hypothetical protein
LRDTPTPVYNLQKYSNPSVFLFPIIFGDWGFHFFPQAGISFFSKNALKRPVDSDARIARNTYLFCNPISPNPVHGAGGPVFWNSFWP